MDAILSGSPHFICVICGNLSLDLEALDRRITLLLFFFPNEPR
jgi:hypothetical protein